MPLTKNPHFPENDFLLVQARLAAVNVLFEGARLGLSGAVWASTLEKVIAGIIQSMVRRGKGNDRHDGRAPIIS